MTTQPRILAVDDEASWLYLYQDILEEAGYEVETVRRFDDALKLIHEQRYDVLIVDLRLAKHDEADRSGLRLVDEMLTADPHVQVVIVTGYGSIDLAVHTLKQGVSDFFVKDAFDEEKFRKSVAQAVNRRVDEFKRVGNPFIPKTGIDPKVFGGRTEELEFFEGKLNDAIRGPYCDHFLILGDWGIGKSTLLREFKKIAQRRGIITAIVPVEQFPAGSSVIDGVESMIQGILRDLPYTASRLEQIVKYFDSIGVSILGTGLEFSRDTSEKKLGAQALLHDTLINLWRDLHSRSPVVAILLDDVQYFAQISEILTTLMQTLTSEAVQNTKILFGLACIPDAWSELTSLKKHHPVSRYFYSKIKLEKLSKAELIETVCQTLAKTGVHFAPDIIEDVYTYTQGHPFEMQVLCHNLFNHQILGRVDRMVWDKALQKTVMDLGSTIFSHWFSEASPDEAEILRIFAARLESLSVKDVQAAFVVSNSSVNINSIEEYVQRLTEKQLLRRVSHGKYEIPDQMFQLYIALLK